MTCSKKNLFSNLLPQTEHLKGFLPFLILQVYFKDINLLNKILLCHFAILGHIYPVWLKFKGGKGVATYLGVIFALSLKLSV